MATLREHFAHMYTAQEARRTATAGEQHAAWKARQAKQCADIDQVERELDAARRINTNDVNLDFNVPVRQPSTPALPASTPLDAPKAQPAAGAPLYALVLHCRAAGLPEPIPEYQFHPTRKWRADYAFVHTTPRVIVEVDGGVWTEGRHTRGKGFIEDQNKLNAAAVMGYLVLRYTPQTLGAVIDDLRAIFGKPFGL